jgi:hypothetical protein
VASRLILAVTLLGAAQQRCLGQRVYGGQCVQYVKAQEPEYNRTYSGGRYWIEAVDLWDLVSDKGPDPRIGSILVIDRWGTGNGSAGHAAIVTQIEGNRVKVTQSNWDQPLHVTEGWFTIVDNGSGVKWDGWTSTYPLRGFVYSPDGSSSGGSPSAKQWTYTYPADYTGTVWIQVAPSPENRNMTHLLVTRWGPWMKWVYLAFNGSQSATLVFTKRYNDGVPLTVTVDPGCSVSFGLGRPGGSVLDYDDGWYLDNHMYRETSRPEVYLYVNGGLLWVQSFDDLTSFGGWGAVSVVDDGSLQVSYGGRLPLDGTIVREIDRPEVWLISNQQRSWISTQQQLDAHGGWAAVRLVPDNSLEFFSRGPNVQ